MLAMIIGAVLALALATTLYGLVTPKWRSQPRSAYFTRPKVLTLIVVFVAGGIGLYTQEVTTLAWVALAIGGWIILESLFAAWKSTSAAERFFTVEEQEADEEVVVAEPVVWLPEPVAAPAAPAVRRNPTPRGPQPKRRRR